MSNEVYLHYIAENQSNVAALVERIKANKPDLLTSVTVIAPSGQARTSTAFAVSRVGPQLGINYMTLGDLAYELSLESRLKEGKKAANSFVKVGILKALSKSDQTPIQDCFQSFYVDTDKGKSLLPNTEQAMLHAFSQLDWIPPAQRQQLNNQDDLIYIYEEFSKALDRHNYISEPQIYEMAVANLQTLPNPPKSKSRKDRRDSENLAAQRIENLGSVILYLPDPLVPLEVRMLEELAEHTQVEILAKHVPGQYFKPKLLKLFLHDYMDQAATPSSTLKMPSSSGQTAVSTRSFANPNQEVKVALKEIYQHLLEGVAPHQLAILFTNFEPYRQLIHDALHSAEIPFTGQTNKTLEQSAVGNCLTALLTLAEEGFHTTAVEKLLAHNPKLEIVNWKHIIRTAAIATGDKQWAEHLDAKHLDHELLVSIIAPILEKLEGLGTDWEADSKTLSDLLEDLLSHSWIQEVSLEREAQNRIIQILGQLPILEELGCSADMQTLSETLQQELSSTTFGRKGRFGRGIYVGSLHSIAGLSVDHVWVLGLAEGIFPNLDSPNKIIQDSSWQKVAESGSQEALQFTQEYKTAQAYLEFNAAKNTSNSSTSKCTSQLFFPLSNTNRGIELIGEPCRWIKKEEVESGSAIQHVDPATLQEYNLQNLSLGLQPPDDSHYEIYKQGTTLLDARASSTLTEFDGYLGYSPHGLEHSYSPTALESFTHCPMSYFYKHVLGVRNTFSYRTPGDLPSPAEMGSLLHKVFEKFNQDQEYSLGADKDESLDELKKMAETRIGELLKDESASSYTPLEGMFLEKCIQNITNAFNYFSQRAEFSGWRNFENEKAIRNLKLSLGEAERVFNVKIDLVERLDGEEKLTEEDSGFGLMAIDYKSGKNDGYQKIDETNPTASGRYLQHVVYSLALSQEYPDSSSIWGGYLFTNSLLRDGQNPIILKATPAYTGSAKEMLAKIIGIIEMGVFPHGIYEKSIYEKTAKEEQGSGVHSCGWCDPHNPVFGSSRFAVETHTRLKNKNVKLENSEMPISNFVYPYSALSGGKSSIPILKNDAQK